MVSESQGPSPEEVRRYVDSLYDRAESDTGTFNATRAAGMIPRQRGTAARDLSRKDSEPAIGNLARQWFDAARAKLGPTLPASQPDRRPRVAPDRAPRAARPVERAPEPRALEAPEAPTGLVPELTGPTPQAPAAGSLPAFPEQRGARAVAGELGREEWRTGAQPVLGGDAARWPLYEPASAPESGPALDPRPAAPESLAGAYRTDLPASGAETYADVPTTGVTAPYATALPVDPTAGSTPGPSADPLTAPYGAALPDLSAPVLEAPAPALLTAPAVAPAPAFTVPAVAPAPARTAPAVTGGSRQAPDAGHRTQAERVVAFAREQIGRPCVWGAVGPGSYDAPGLTQAAWKAAGVTLPRTVQAQWEAGVQVPLADVQVGDLVFFHDDRGHVGVWSGDGMMIHAPGPGALIREESVFFAGQSAIRGAVRPA
jgi:cell wall-associated NlpC family hydrolase